MKIMDIALENCPQELQTAVSHRLQDTPVTWELLSLTMHESTPYIDKMKVLCTHEAILCAGNVFLVLNYMEGFGRGSLTESIVSVMSVEKIIEKSPSWLGLRKNN